MAKVLSVIISLILLVLVDEFATYFKHANPNSSPGKAPPAMDGVSSNRVRVVEVNFGY